jgi:hypothetical protein
VHVIVLTPRGSQHHAQWQQGVMNYIMGFCVLVTMNTTQEVDIYRVMGCVHMHRGILAIEGWGNPNCIQNVVKKIEKTSRKPKKIGRIISQTPTSEPKHNKIQTQWTSRFTFPL